ncbi:hypothetical protein TorRG33x02_110650 [Trema orientale]|uniref:RxLR effector protein n=1 Tax=Trema orientale TaxID=63057 RepID=A0A2P5F5W0_TREOI|nr:hypothetical protein TorRG33x02_110650 [Trema orientale]
MKIAVALLVAFVMILLGSLVEAANAKSSTSYLASAKIDGHDTNNIGRKVNVGAFKKHIEGKASKYHNINSIEVEDDNDVNEAFNKTGSQPTTDVHRLIIDRPR